MAIRGLFDRSALILKKSMDLRLQNQQVISSNIANAETPGYAVKRLEFTEELRQAVQSRPTDLACTHPDHLPYRGETLEQVQGKVVEYPDQTGVGDGNSVNVDEEMILLTENQVLYEATTQLLNKKLSILKYTIQGQ
ncbi:MAG: flagellar basal body rod protein FlgB [Desulfuromonadaceae bacterium]|nr:flagellar basal body rod protein FlgB [Desulfuromonadaceae bacterium]